jgi:hypothetical protein
MRKIALALGSFIVGACSAFLALSLSQTSTRVQAAGQATGVRAGGAEPIVPPLGVRLEDSGIGAFETQPLDGINCVRCSIDVGVITYAGGAFNCDGCSIQAKRVQLKGAALNTFNALRFFGVIPNPTPTVPQQSPIQRASITLTLQNPVKWVSLEGLQK